MKLNPAMSLLEYQALTIEVLKFEEKYSDYWNSTADDDGGLVSQWSPDCTADNTNDVIGQLVDAVIMPVAPHAAVIPGRFYHKSYTAVINLMNYSAAVIPVTKADKTIDIPDRNFEPLSPED